MARGAPSHHLRVIGRESGWPRLMWAPNPGSPGPKEGPGQEWAVAPRGQAHVRTSFPDKALCFCRSLRGAPAMLFFLEVIMLALSPSKLPSPFSTCCDGPCPVFLVVTGFLVPRAPRLPSLDPKAGKPPSTPVPDLTLHALCF